VQQGNPVTVLGFGKGCRDGWSGGAKVEIRLVIRQ
jgi:hypothetical protein